MVSFIWFIYDTNTLLEKGYYSGTYISLQVFISVIPVFPKTLWNRWKHKWKHFEYKKCHYIQILVREVLLVIFSWFV